MRNVLLLASVLTLVSASPVAAQYGRNDNPNMRNFYMARQQWQVMDDTPQVNDLRTNPAAAQPGAAAAPPRPAALPRAGFNSYMSGYMGTSPGQGLPSVNNGVPKLPPAGPNLTGQQATAQKMKAKAPAAPKAAKAPPVAKGYKPYTSTASSGYSGGGSSSMSTSTAVHGSVLHWNKKRPGY